MLTQKEIIALLTDYKNQKGKQYGIEQIGIFGSFARGTANPQSDIDVFVKLKKSNLFLLSRIRIDLQELLETHVDLVEIRKHMNRYLKKHIEEESLIA